MRVIGAIIMFVILAVPVHAAPRAIDVAKSKITLYVDKQGMFAFLADNHEIDAPLASGSYDAETKSVELTFEAAKLRVLDPKLSAGRRADVQANMLSPKVLDVEQYPKIEFHSTKIVETDASHWTVTGDLTLHGKTQPLNVSVVQSDPSHFTGSATVRQTAFGIVPIKVGGGTVAVKDDIRVTFDVAVTP